jgi:hypothetical protein
MLKAGRAQNLHDRKAGSNQAHSGVEQSGTALRADQDCQPGRITRRNVRKVEN